MADLENCGPPADASAGSGGCCLMRTILLHGVMVTILFSGSLFAFLYNIGTVAVVVELIAYLALGCLYIYNSSRRQEKFIFAGYLVLVLSVFLLSSNGIIVPSASERQPDDLHAIDGLLFGANMVAITTYCVWQLSFILSTMPTILHAAMVAILFALIFIGFYLVPEYDSSNRDTACLVQLVAYNAVCCLYICNDSSRHEKAKSVGFLVVLVFLSLLASFASRDPRASLIFTANIVVLREFSNDEIQAMTQDFGSMIGRGGSAQVFQGNLGDDTPVAVKRINIHGGRTMAGEEDFRRELSIIANVHHRSLVRLLGYCLQRGGGLYLVYPFFENGSLDRWIFHGSEGQRRQLTWRKRLGIAIDVARALAYLHNECHRRILHLDVKPGNILLDDDLRAHVSDFGISLSITWGLNSVVDTEHLKGTFGYMAPEMLYNAVSDKSDVFSYGMTLLELVGGRRNMYPSSSDTTDLTRDYFPYIVREKVKRGEVTEAVDVAMAPVDDEEAVKTVLKVALCCIQNQREMRPAMQTVVDMLEGRAAVELPPENRHHLL